MAHGIGKQAGGINARPHQSTDLATTQAVIDPGGVIFSDGAELIRLTPELSIRWQEQLGADIIFAFDEATSPLHDLEYNRQALDRTHRWAQQCLAARTRADQLLFGIVQGGPFAELRAISAQVIRTMPFEGWAIGGSYGQHEMVEVLRTVMPLLPEAQPVHALGIGWLQDIILAVDQGIDLFDCVEPVRRARHRSVLTATGYGDVVPVARDQADGPLVLGCDCRTCTTMPATQVKALCQAGDWAGSRALAIHNVRMMVTFMRDIRQAITDGRWQDWKAERLARIERDQPTVVSG